MFEMDAYSSGPIEESLLAKKEKEWGCKLPDSYRTFLLRFNGGRPKKDVFNFKNSNNGSNIDFFLGLVPDDDDLDIDEHLDCYRKRLPESFFPIAYDSGGNLICISTAADDIGKVYFWDHELEADINQGQSPETVDNTILIADDFDEFLHGLKEKQMA